MPLGTLHISLFGHPRFSIDEEPFKFAAPPKALPLLAYLLLHRDVAVPREKLAFTLWEDESEDDARANLRRHLHHLQRALPKPSGFDSWLLVDGDAVQWNPAAGAWIDVAEFERLVGDETTRERAVALYGGELLETLYDEWIFPARDRLRNAYLAALGDLLIEARGARDGGKATAFARAILENDPWREDTIRQLMSVRYESGDRAGALAVYDQFDRKLRDEMNVDPMPETTALRDAIRRNDPLPSSGAARPQPESAGGTSPLLPFVGREQELERLRVLWSRAARGRGRLVLIGGEAGIGKSRLAQEFAVMAEAQGARVLFGTTSYPESTPYQAIAEALRRAAPLAASLHMSELWLGVVAQAVPELRSRRPELPVPPKVEPERERIRLFEAIAMCLEALARPRPLVVVLEDLHWAGEGTIAALRYLARRVASLPILLVATFRDEETRGAHPLRSARRELLDEDAASTLTPRPLKREAIGELLHRLPDTTGGDPEIAGVLLERSAGVPLFVGEVIRELLESPDRSAVLLPDAAQVIDDRLRRLPPRSRALAEAASVVGPGFDIDLVRDVTGWSENDVLDALSDLIDRQIVRETGGRSGFAYAFSHHLVQRAAYAGVDERTRVRRHRHIATRLDEYYGDRPGHFAADVARHYDLGHDPEKASAKYLEAAQQAIGVYAFDEALAHIRRCMELTADPQRRWDALFAREAIHARRGMRDEQAADLEQLGAIAAAVGDAMKEFEATARSAAYERAVGQREKENELVERLERIAAASGTREFEARALLMRAAHATLAGDVAVARKAGEDALAIYEALDDELGIFEANCRIVEVDYSGGSFARASAVLEKARKAAAVTGNIAVLARAFASATTAAITEQRYETCRTLALEGREICRTIGDREGEADLIARLASSAARLSLVDESRRFQDEAIAAYRSIGKGVGIAAVLVNSGVQSVRLGYVDEAETALRAAESQFEALGDLRGQAAASVNLSYVRLFVGDPAEAKRIAQRALELALRIQHAGYEAAALANLGGAERDLGDIAAAITAMERGLEIRRRLNQPGDYADDVAHLMLVYLMAGRVDDARALGDELSTSLAAASNALFMPQFAFWIAAQAYRALGDARAARGLVERAGAIVREQADAMASSEDRDRLLSLHVNREVFRALDDDAWPALPKVAATAG